MSRAAYWGYISLTGVEAGCDEVYIQCAGAHDSAGRDGDAELAELVLEKAAVETVEVVLLSRDLHVVRVARRRERGIEHVARHRRELGGVLDLRGARRVADGALARATRCLCSLGAPAGGKMRVALPRASAGAMI